MSPTKPGKKLKRKLSDRQKAQRETMALFQKTKLTPDGRKRVKEIFALTTGRFISNNRGKKVWKGALKEFVLRCTAKVAGELAGKGGTDGASREDVQQASVKWMKSYKHYSKICQQKLQDPPPRSGLQGPICDPFLILY